MAESYHIFYFPFIVKHDGAEDTIVKALNTIEQGNLWKRVYQDGKDECYAEKMYYHHFVHNALNDNGKKLFYTSFSQKKKDSNSDYSLVLHYERTDVSSGQLKFKIRARGKELFVLDIENITLDYYFTNVCILSLHVRNDKYFAPQNILDINYYGRALYNLIKEENIDNEIYCPQDKECQVKNNNKDSKRSKNLYKLYNHIHQVLDEFFSEANINLTSIEDYLPVFDNKMFVNCCYLNNQLSKSYSNDGINGLSNELFWQNFVEIDCGQDFGCQNFEMRQALTRKNSYLRWQNFGTLYGITDRSFVCLCSDAEFSKNKLLPHMKTIYSQMVKLVLVQRASLLSFSDSISRVNLNTDNIEAADIIGKIYRNYIVYIKKLYFVNITSQIQGVELYEKLHNTFNIKEYIESFDNELSKMNVYLSALKDSDKRESQNNLFNLLAGLFLPATLVSGILGMNNMLDQNQERIQILEVPITKYIILDLVIVIAFSLVFWLLMCFNKTIREIVSKNKFGFLAIFIVLIMIVVLLVVNKLWL